MLARFPLLAFVPVADLGAAGAFYGEVLGLQQTDQIPGMVTVFDAGGTSLRVTLVPDHVASHATVAGWSVPDVHAVLGALAAHGVSPLRYDMLPADEAGVWTAPGGDQVCWFTDPSGNVLSLTQFAPRPSTRLRSIAPVLPTRSVKDALARLARMGFTVDAFGGPADADDAFYGFASRDGVDLHVARVDGLDPKTSMVSVYLYVEDADTLYREWHASGVDGHFHEPKDTDYGLREGAYVDPDGNLFRFGSFVTSD